MAQSGRRTQVFVDQVHRFSKSQPDFSAVGLIAADAFKGVSCVTKSGSRWQGSKP
jgi:hypothetical protein